jgi:4-alpha-glucanotransferase
MRFVPLIAEDLGMITEPVHALRKQFLLPGMNVLQFQLPGSEKEPYAPQSHELNSVVYTGTHDNDTSLGWFRSDVLPFPERLERLKTWIPCDESNFAWEFIELAWDSPAALAVTPLQDVLGLGSESRMNTPGTSGDDSTNWCWKFQPGALTAELAARLREVTARKGRLG